MKKEKKESVIHDWVTELPFTQQALLMLALRGPDGMPKHSTAKGVLYHLRGLVLKPAYPDFSGNDGFMSIKYDRFNDAAELFFRDTDAYPMHFLMHLIHAAEVVAYSHPQKQIRDDWYQFYSYACHCFHMTPETYQQLNKRLAY